jgi:hypothetical protein
VPQERNFAFFGGFHQRCGTWPQFLALGETDETIALFPEIEAVLDFAAEFVFELFGQKAEQELARYSRCLQAHFFLLVLEHHVVVARRTHAPGLAERNIGACHVLHLDRRMLPDVRHPGALVLPQAAQESAGFTVGAAVIGEAGQGLDQAVDEFRAKAHRWPLLQSADIDLVTDDSKVGVKARADVNIGGQDFHMAATCIPRRSGHLNAGPRFPPKFFCRDRFTGHGPHIAPGSDSGPPWCNMRESSQVWLRGYRC